MTSTMSTQTSPVVRSSKRKRTTVSYAETDLIDHVLSEVENGDQEEEDVDTDDDGEFGKRQKKRKRVAKPKPQKKQKPFPFQSLPAELRNTIFALALTDPRGGVHLEAKSRAHRRVARHCDPFWGYSSIYAVSETNNPDPSELLQQWDRGELTPALLATSKAVYAEAAPILYGGQRFVARDGFALMAFLMGLRPETVARLRHVAVHDWADTRSHTSTNLPAVAMLRDASAALERLEIHTPFIGRQIRYPRHIYYNKDRLVTPVIRLARKIYRDCHPLLYAVMRARGLDAAADVVKPAKQEWESLIELDKNNNTSATPPDEKAEVERLKGLYAEELRRLLAGSS
ncbi:hypothetical protein PG999_003619 [Apiospora kogelbergensis]|uniref:DUF7730 domain-containing protein n=1 Tax=Apiospora kogelbergensis TaxID=1337665 RepID=A0AAW0R4B2_9PEZI